MPANAAWWRRVGWGRKEAAPGDRLVAKNRAASARHDDGPVWIRRKKTTNLIRSIHSATSVGSAETAAGSADRSTEPANVERKITNRRRSVQLEVKLCRSLACPARLCLVDHVVLRSDAPAGRRKSRTDAEFGLRIGPRIGSARSSCPFQDFTTF